MPSTTRPTHDTQSPHSGSSAAEAAWAASAEIAAIRASGTEVCDVSHILGAMRMATARARQEARQSAEPALTAIRSEP